MARATLRPAITRGTGALDALHRVSGRVTLNLMCPRTQAIGKAGQVEGLPAGCVVVLRVAGPPEPAVVDRLRTFGGHLQFEVHGRDGRSTAGWVQALRDGFGWVCS